MRTPRTPDERFALLPFLPQGPHHVDVLPWHAGRRATDGAAS